MIDEKLVNDLFFRQRCVQKALQKAEMDGILLTTDVNIYYMTGLVFNGYYYLPADGEPLFFVKRPAGICGERIFSIHKPEQIPEIFASNGWTVPRNILLELDEVSYNECLRLHHAFRFRKIDNATHFMRRIRMIKTQWEIEQMCRSAESHVALYAQIADCYRSGMTDLLFQAEIEYRMRLQGSIGVFRTFGPKMNIFMGSVLAGENAEVPSPYDFALGGAGQTAFCPVGANGTLLKEGMAIMVDMVGNFTEYLSDMTRVFAIGSLTEQACKAHQVALEIQDAIEIMAQPGVACADLFNKAMSIVEKTKLTACFMGIRQQAKFIGHGIGLEINEPPIIAPRSKEVLEPGMTFALEPKFVIPQVGAVGVENSYLVTETGVEKLTNFMEEVIVING